MSTPPPVSAEVVAVGSELLGVDRADTNSVFLTSRLDVLGIELGAKCVVGDRFATLSAIVGQALARADLVLLTGGLGPTDDDVTRAAVSSVLGRALYEDTSITDAIRKRFESRGLQMPEINRRQAQVPDGAVVLENRWGTAPGLWIEHEGRLVVLLPGPPRELEPMFDTLVMPRLEARYGTAGLARRTVRLVGRTESHADEALQPLYAAWATREPPVAATILASRGTIELQLSARHVSAAEAGRAVDVAADEIVAVMGDDVCSTDGRSLEQVVGDLLRARGMTIALAESCTGGLVTSRLTDVPGSSDYVDRGVVAYSNRTKVDLLGVPAEMIVTHGAVSEPVAVAMAEGVRRLAGAGMGVGVTGIAGPGGGTPTKPVGTVAMAVAGPDAASSVRTIMVPGERTRVKVFASTAVLDTIRRALRTTS